MPSAPVVPPAVIGVLGAVWYALTLVFGLDDPVAGELAAGGLFSLLLYLLLAGGYHAPVEPVLPQPWSRSLAVGWSYAAAAWFIGAAAFGNAGGFLIAALSAAAAVGADRRVAAIRRTRILHRVLLALVVIGALAESARSWLDTGGYVATGVLGGALLAAFTPLSQLVRLIQPAMRDRTGVLMPPDIRMPGEIREPLQLTGSPETGADQDVVQAGRDLAEFADEVLALCAFLAPDDIPQGLVLAVVRATRTRRAPALTSLSAAAISVTDPDSLRVDPLRQRFARHRLGVDERRFWAGHAVRMLAASFPRDSTDPGSWPWCERLLPHAIAVAEHAQQIPAEPGAAIWLLNNVTRYLVHVGRPEEAREVAARALSYAATVYGPETPETAALSAELATIAWQLEDPDTAIPTLEHAVVTLSRSTRPDAQRLARYAVQLGDMRREIGQVSQARRDYLVALRHAKHSLPRKHPLIAEVQSRMSELPPPTAAELDGRPRVALWIITIAAVILVSGSCAVLTDFRSRRMQPSSVPLAKPEMLATLCADKPRYYPAATGFGGTAPHPIQIFVRTDQRANYHPAGFTGEDVPSFWQPDERAPESVQLVACAKQLGTGLQLITCSYPDHPAVPLFEAIYQVSVFETSTGRLVARLRVTSSDDRCPQRYEPGADDSETAVYATPSFSQFEELLEAYVQR